MKQLFKIGSSWKMLFLFLGFVLFGHSNANAQSLIKENFNYSPGALAGQGTWVVNKSATPTIEVIEKATTFANYLQEANTKAVQLNPVGEKLATTLVGEGSNISSGSVYYSAIINVSEAAATNGIIAFASGVNATQYGARLCAKKNAEDKLIIGISRSGSSSSTEATYEYTKTAYEFNTDLLVVVKYTFVEGEKNDEVKLYVFSSLSSVPTEPINPDAQNKIAGNADLADIGAFVLTQGTSFTKTFTAQLTALRVACTWGDLFSTGPAPDAPTLTFNSTLNYNYVFQGTETQKGVVFKGKNLSGDITVTAPTHTDLSLDKNTLSKVKLESAEGDTLLVTLKTNAVAQESYTDPLSFSGGGITTASLQINWSPLSTTSVTTLSEMRSKPQNTESYFLLKNEILVSYVEPGESDRLYVQDETGGYQLNDAYGVLTSSYKTGDKIKNVIVVMEEIGGSTPRSLVLQTDPGKISSENTITPVKLTLKALEENKARYESVLIQIDTVEFYNRETEGGVFKASHKIRQSEDQTKFLCKTFTDADFKGDSIPEKAVVIGVSTSAAGNVIAPRSKADLIKVEKPPVPPIPPVPGGENRFSNGGFETWEGGGGMFPATPVDWSTDMSATSKETVEKVEGLYSLKISGSAGLTTRKIAQELRDASKPFMKGETYQLRIRFFVDETQEGKDIKLASYWNAGSEGPLTADQAILNNGIFFTSNGTWTTKTFVTTVPEKAVSFYFCLEMPKGIVAYFDDFSFEKIESPEVDPKIMVQPETLANLITSVGKSVKTPKITVSGQHLSEAVKVEIVTGDSSYFTSSLSSVATKDFPAQFEITYLPTKAGKHTSRLRLSSKDAETIEIILKGTANDPSQKGVITVNSDQLTDFSAAVGGFMAQKVSVSAVQMEDYVYVKREGSGMDAFIIGNTMLSKDLDNEPFEIKFQPKASGVYQASIVFYSKNADTVKVAVKGTASATDSSWMETFEIGTKPLADRAYVTAVKGSWDMSGTIIGNDDKVDVFNGKQSTRLISDQAYLAMDFDIPSGIGALSLLHASCKNVSTPVEWILQVSKDFGLTWKNVGSAQKTAEEGVAQIATFTVNQAGLSRIRIVKKSGGAMNIDDISIKPYSSSEIVDLFDLDTNYPCGLLNEHFDSTRHNKALALPSWKNVVVKGKRPWWGFSEKENNVEVNRCAKATAYIYQAKESEDYEMWMVTPALDFKNAKSKFFTFRVMGDFMFKDHESKIELYYMERNGNEYYKNKIAIEMPVLPDVNGEWMEFHLDLSGQDLADVFFMGFCFTGPSGEANSVTYNIDDVSFGREDLPRIHSSVDSIELSAEAFKVIESEYFTISGKALTESISISVGGDHPSAFTPEVSILPTSGGEIKVLFVGAEQGLYSAYLRLSSRGAADLIIPMKAHVSQATPKILVSEKNLSIQLVLPGNIGSFVCSDSIVVNPFVLTESIRIAVEGTDAALFSTSRTSILATAVNESFVITYKPVQGGKHTAQIRLSSKGATDVIIQVSGSSKSAGVEQDQTSRIKVFKANGAVNIISGEVIQNVGVYGVNGIRKAFYEVGNSSYAIPCEEIGLGLYLLKIKTPTGTQTVKIVN